MNDECLFSHKGRLRNKFQDAHIVPVPMRRIGQADTAKKFSKNAAINIVSVGRIVPFKAYNFGITEVVRALSDDSLDVAWDIYGHGPDVDKLIKLVEEANKIPRSRISFMGPLPYESFPEVIRKYDIFVGMGTAAVEAAQLGTPTICAIDGSHTKAYGFLDELPFGNVGERLPERDEREISDLITSFVRASESEKELVARRCSAAAAKYDFESYLELCALHSIQPKHIWNSSLLYCRFYLWMARDNWLRKVFRGLASLIGMRRDLPT
jgi:glycosyltransferase involved in cell wall biosynthesis